MESPFDVLLIDSDADDETIEQAYRTRVKEAHPDQGGSVEEFQRVRTAYEMLKAGWEPSEDAPPEPAEPGERSPAAENGDREGAARWREQAAEGESWTRAEEYTISSTVTYLNYDVLADFGWDHEDADLFAKAADADLDEEDYGQFQVDPGESLLEAAERHGYAWPFSCRGGACANCAILLLEGELSMPVNHILPPELMEQDIRLSCNGMPITDELKVVYNVKHMPELDDLLLPPRSFARAHLDD